MYLTEELRGTGLGSAVIKAFIKYADSAGIKTLFAETNSKLKSENLLLEAGFVRSPKPPEGLKSQLPQDGFFLIRAN
jgi:GNAT superfamily N-acetyltransferase